MNIIRKLRKERGLSQEELAKAVHVHQTAVSQWETGRHFPDTAQAIELANFFNVTTDYLLGNNTNNRSSPKEKKEAHSPRNGEELLRDYFHSKIGRDPTQEEFLKLKDYAEIFVKSVNK